MAEKLIVINTNISRVCKWLSRQARANKYIENQPPLVRFQPRAQIEKAVSHCETRKNEGRDCE